MIFTNTKMRWPPQHSYYAHKIPDSDKFNRIVQLFEQIDADGNKRLDKKELDTVFKYLGCPKTKSQLKSLLFEYDLNNDKNIDFDEFINMASNQLFYRWPPVYADYKEEIPSEDRFNEIYATFKMFDVDNDSQISIKELRKAMAKMGHRHDDKTIRMMHEFVDIDGDGNIQFNEFVKLIEIEDASDMKSPEAVGKRESEAFKMMSSNGIFITKNDLRNFSKKVFPSELDANEIDAIMEVVAEGKDVITFEDAKERMFKIMQIQ